MKQVVKIIKIENLTHDVIRVVAEKPVGLKFLPGQAIDISINKNGWENELRAFTFTSLPDDKNIEFTIKKVIYTYEEHIKEINQSAEYCVSCEESFLSAKDLESTQKKS